MARGAAVYAVYGAGPGAARLQMSLEYMITNETNEWLSNRIETRIGHGECKDKEFKVLALGEPI